MAWWVPWVLVLALGLVVALIVGEPGEDGVPLDPESTGPLGSRALVEVLRELGADVTVTPPRAPDADVVMLLADRYRDTDRARLERWVRGGGTLLLLDANSPLNPQDVVARVAFDLIGDVPLSPGCDAALARGVRRVTAPSWTALDGAGATAACFPLEDGYGVVVVSQGGGEVVVVGMAGIATNDGLGREDNALLLANLAVPRPGTRVTVLGLPAPGAGDRSLGDLVPPAVWALLAQLVVGFAVLAWWRSRRLGQPVSEAVPVAVPGSQLVVAVGELLHRTGHRDAAATRLRDDLRRDLGHSLGLGADAPLAEVVAAASARSAAAPERLRTVLEERALRDDGELLALARTIETVRREVSGSGRRTYQEVG